jgi:tRNA A37 threonylcarbamoyladenosine dehydratase
MGEFDRTALLLGAGAMEKLAKARVAIFGLGGVGGYVAEALARSGVGALELIDHDTISLSNINRQVLALHSTVGFPKAEAARLRVLDINPNISAVARQEFYGPDTAKEFDFSQYDYVVDAIDTVTGKLALITAAKAANVPILCCMGTGNKLDPGQFRITDISKTSICPLARIMRKECAKRGLRDVKVLYSTEEALTPQLTEQDLAELPEGRRTIPGSVAFVPSVAGLMIAGQVIRDLTNI